MIDDDLTVKATREISAAAAQSVIAFADAWEREFLPAMRRFREAAAPFERALLAGARLRGNHDEE